jgi:hypothetical protein
MLLKMFKPKEKAKEESIFQKIVKTPDHIQDILLEKYFIQGSEQPSGELPIMTDLKVMYDKLMTITEPFVYLYLNPFSGKYITVELNPVMKNYRQSSYMQTDDKAIIAQNYFGSLKVSILKANVMDGSFDNRYINFKNVLYHELAHAHFGNILTVLSQTHEVNADISSIIYIIKNEDLSLNEAKYLIDSVLRMRVKTANLFRYTVQICKTLRAHSTEDALILFRCMDEEVLNTLKKIDTTDIVRYVTLWLQSVSGLLVNPYAVDFENKHLVSFLFHNNYNPIPMITDGETMCYVRTGNLKKLNDKFDLFKRRFYIPPATEDEMDIMKGFYLLNIFLRPEYFNDFMTSHMLVNDFDYIVNNLFNKDDYKYVFLDSISAYEKYKNDRANAAVHIPFGYKEKELDNFILNNHCKT